MVSSISGALMSNVRELILYSINRYKNEYREGYNFYTDFGYSVYVMTCNVLEAFLNEGYLSEAAKPIRNTTILYYFDPVAIEKMELTRKLQYLPDAYFNKKLDKSKQPFQDLKILVQLRNEIVHFKMKVEPPKVVKSLKDRKIILKDEGLLWTHSISCSLGMLWAYNTVCKVIHELLSFDAGKELRTMHWMAENFKLFPEKDFFNFAKEKIK